MSRAIKVNKKILDFPDECLQTLGKMHSCQGDHTEASIILSEAREQSIKIGNRLGTAECLLALGNNVCFKGKYVEAKELLTQARDEFLNIGDSRGVEQCESSFIRKIKLLLRLT